MVDSIKISCNTPDEEGKKTPFLEEEVVPQKNRKKPNWHKILMTVLYAAIACVFVYMLVSQFMFVVFEVDGPSMENTLKDGERVFVSKTDKQYAAGDIIVFEREAGNKKYKVIKRLIALPTQRVRIVDGIVYVNDKALDEPYAINKTDSDCPEITLGNDEVFVLGDNRKISEDSSEYGGIKAVKIIGKVVKIKS